MNIFFEPMSEKHGKEIMRIFNHYVETGTAAFPARALPEQFYAVLMKKGEGYPSYALLDGETVIGFCQLSALNPFSSFAKTACLSYFLAPEYTGKGVGSLALARLEQEAKQKNISRLVAEISSENEGSIAFHMKHGFAVAGQLHDVGEKFGRSFGLVTMEKAI